MDLKYFPAEDLEDQDKREIMDFEKRVVFDKNYIRVMEDWQLNLERSRKAKARTKQLLEEYVQTII